MSYATTSSNGFRARGTTTTRAVLAAGLCGIVLIGIGAFSPAGGTVGPAAADGSVRCLSLGKGTRGADRFIGTQRGDLVNARGGRDRIFGSGGADCLHGGRGADRIRGGRGRDTIKAGSGRDAIKVQDGVVDVVNCGPGNDSVVADREDILKGCERVEAPPATEPPDPGTPAECGVEATTLTAPGCALVNTDTGVNGDVGSLWGNLECVNSSRHRLFSSDGDPHPTATGLDQGDASYRRLTVFDGDNYSGERCELGRNEYRYGTDGGDGTFALYREGNRRITFASIRIPSGLPIQSDNWRTVLQMKQSQPSTNGGGAPMIVLELREGMLRAVVDTVPIWGVPAPVGQWTRVAFDVNFSRFSGQGSLKMYIDRNADGDVSDSDEQSPEFHGATLRPETSPGATTGSVAPGESLPSHLRVGIYHNPVTPCSAGCSIEVDNIQVVKPS